MDFVLTSGSSICVLSKLSEYQPHKELFQSHQVQISLGEARCKAAGSSNFQRTCSPGIEEGLCCYGCVMELAQLHSSVEMEKQTNLSLISKFSNRTMLLLFHIRSTYLDSVLFGIQGILFYLFDVLF